MSIKSYKIFSIFGTILTAFLLLTLLGTKSVSANSSSAEFNVGDTVQISSGASKESNGYDLTPRRGFIGTVVSRTPIAKNSNSYFEYHVDYGDGTGNWHVLEQDLNKAPNPLFSKGDNIQLAVGATGAVDGSAITSGTKGTVLSVSILNKYNSHYQYQVDFGTYTKYIYEQDMSSVAKYAVGDTVQISNGASKESNGYALTPRRGFVGTVDSVTPITKNSNAYFEYHVDYGDGTGNVHVLEQDLQTAPKAKFAKGQTVQLSSGATNAIDGSSITPTAKGTVVNVSILNKSNSHYQYQVDFGSASKNIYEQDLTTPTTESDVDGAGFKLGDYVQLTSGALNASDGTSIKAHQGFIGQITAVKSISKIGSSVFEYSVSYGDGTLDAHVLQQDLQTAPSAKFTVGETVQLSSGATNAIDGSTITPDSVGKVQSVSILNKSNSHYQYLIDFGTSTKYIYEQDLQKPSTMRVIANQTATTTYNLNGNFGGFWNGSVKVTIGYDIHFDTVNPDNKPYVTVTSVSAVPSGFGQTSTGAGFVDAFFLTKNTDGITPADGYKYHIVQPENTGNVVNYLNNIMSKDSRFITGFYHDNKSLKSGQLNTNFSKYNVSMNSDGSFTLVQGYAANRVNVGANNDYRHFFNNDTYSVKVNVPSIISYSFVDEYNNPIDGSRNMKLADGYWSNPDGTKTLQTTDNSGSMSIMGYNGKSGISFNTPAFDGYAFDKKTTTLGTDNFGTKPNQIVYHYYHEGFHDVTFVDKKAGTQIKTIDPSVTKDLVERAPDGQKWSFTMPSVDNKDTELPADYVRTMTGGYQFVSSYGAGVTDQSKISSSGVFDHTKTGIFDMQTVYFMDNSSKINYQYVDDYTGKVVNSGELDGIMGQKGNLPISYDTSKYQLRATNPITVSDDPENLIDTMSRTSINYQHDYEYYKTQTITIHLAPAQIILPPDQPSEFTNHLKLTTNNFVSDSPVTSVYKDLQRTDAHTKATDAQNSWHSITQGFALTDTSGLAGATGKMDLNLATQGLSSGVINVGQVKVYTLKMNATSLTDVTSNFDVTVDTANNNIKVSQKTADAIADNQQGVVYYVDVTKSWKAGGDASASTTAWSSNGTSQKGQLINKTSNSVDVADVVTSTMTYHTTNLAKDLTSYDGKASGLKPSVYTQTAYAQSVSGNLIDGTSSSSARSKSITRGLNETKDSYGYDYTISVPFLTNDGKISSKVSDTYNGGTKKYGYVGSLGFLSEDSATEKILHNGSPVTGNSLTSWGDNVDVITYAHTANGFGVSDTSWVSSSMDSVNGVLPNSFTLISNGLRGNNITVSDLTVNIDKATATIRHLKYGTDDKTKFADVQRVTNPNEVPDQTEKGYDGLLFKPTNYDLVGWKLVNPPANGIAYGSNYDLFYTRPLATANNKITIYRAIQADTSKDISSSNVATGKWRATIAIVANNMWSGYKISTDSDITNSASYYNMVNRTNKSVDKVLGAPLKETTQNNSDGTVNVTAYYQTDYNPYTLTSSSSDFVLDAPTVINSKAPWLTNDSQAGALTTTPILYSQNNITNANLNYIDDSTGIKKTSSLMKSPVAMVVSNTSSDPMSQTRVSNTFYETTRLSDDAVNFSIPAGYGFTNKISMTVNTYSGWSKDGKDDTAYQNMSNNTTTKLDSSIADEYGGDTSHIYQASTVDKTVGNIGGTPFNNGLEEKAQTYSVSLGFKPSKVHRGATAQQVFDSSKYRATDVDADNQLLIPTDAKMSHSIAFWTTNQLSIGVKYSAGSSDFSFWNNPSFDLTKKISISAPRYVDVNDWFQTKKYTPIAFDNVQYNTVSNSDVNKFVNTGN